jgi:hypothetical protein
LNDRRSAQPDAYEKRRGFVGNRVGLFLLSNPSGNIKRLFGLFFLQISKQQEFDLIFSRFLSILVVLDEKMGAKMDSRRIPSAHFGVYCTTKQLHGPCQSVHTKAKCII